MGCVGKRMLTGTCGASALVREYHPKDRPVRFDVVEIEETPGQPPEVSLHRAAFKPGIAVRFG